ncbi:Fructosamine kinase-domain-containing protein [Xylariaceae sp. FL1272]|nr:Fructosamine kinase-domain-containing protein [Xylariaceae sp. FL1272]
MFKTTWSWLPFSLTSLQRGEIPYQETQRNATIHEGDIEVDKNIIAQFPPGAIVISCRGHGASYWNKTARLDVEGNGKRASYFLKLTAGDVAGPMLEGEYESMKLIHKFVPYFSPKAMDSGKCADSDQYFSLYSFHDLQKGDPDIPRFTEAVAQLHNLSAKASPDGKFGFHVTTYNDILPQDNASSDSWEEFYVRGMRHMLNVEKERRGLNPELEELSTPVLEKVIPRLLWPMETGGRSIRPVLIHCDLWLGNVSTQKDSGDPLVYDHRHSGATTSLSRQIPQTEPQEDWDARNALYSTRAIIHDSALWPDVEHFRKRLITEMRRLVEVS